MTKQTYETLLELINWIYANILSAEKCPARDKLSEISIRLSGVTARINDATNRTELRTEELLLRELENELQAQHVPNSPFKRNIQFLESAVRGIRKHLIDPVIQTEIWADEIRKEYETP